ncbi:MAG: hypothetical protein QGF12_02695 [SAR202 cluster bacterium]|jgi:hypothetical protein|nr:hypothetical protein [SAR202 cluster bacterium]
MKLVLVGCEYAGTSTLASKIYAWSHKIMAKGLPIIHGHWKFPETWGHPEGATLLKGMTDEERDQVMAMSPRLREMTTRQSLYYHIFPSRDDESALGQLHRDFLFIGLHIEDAIYAPLYFNYGIKNEFDVDRRVVMEQVEKDLLIFNPETTLVLVKAQADVIARRMRDEPRNYGVIKEEDIKLVLRRFEEEFESSKIPHKIILDTSNVPAEETFAEFVRQYEPFFSDSDKARILEKANQGT